MAMKWALFRWAALAAGKRLQWHKQEAKVYEKRKP